jgi:hypothetical protein
MDVARKLFVGLAWLSFSLLRSSFSSPALEADKGRRLHAQAESRGQP